MGATVVSSSHSRTLTLGSERSKSFALDKETLAKSLSLLNPERSYFLHDLLPYDPATKVQGSLKKGLEEYKFLLDIAEQAFTAFQNGELGLFDPLVGENACQIRALQVAVMAQHVLDDQALEIQKIVHIKSRIESILNHRHTNLSDKGLLIDVLTSQSLTIRLNYGCKFLLQCYLLTISKKRRENNNNSITKKEYIDIKSIKSRFSLGTMFTESMVKNFRKEIAYSSVIFIHEIVSALSYKSIVSNKFQNLDQLEKSHNGLLCLPYYLTMIIVLVVALSLDIPIRLYMSQKATDMENKLIRQEVLFFQATDAGYVSVDESEQNFLGPVINVYGITADLLNRLPKLKLWKERLLSQGCTNLFLAYAACHRQYPDSATTEVSFDDKDFSFYKAKGLELGCSIEHPEWFFLVHMNCSGFL